MRRKSQPAAHRARYDEGSRRADPSRQDAGYKDRPVGYAHHHGAGTETESEGVMDVSIGSCAVQRRRSRLFRN